MELSRPDMTLAVDWVLNNDYLSIYCGVENAGAEFAFTGMVWHMIIIIFIMNIVSIVDSVIYLSFRFVLVKPVKRGVPTLPEWDTAL